MFDRLFVLSLVCFGCFTGTALRATERDLVFEKDIRPLVQKKCGKCHSAKVQKGALDLSTMQALRRGGESGEQLVAESLDDSYLWSMIDGGEMPPAGEPRLADQELERIRRWLLSGAKSSATLSAKRLSQHDVIPIVLLRCVTCHGARIKRGGLDLRTPQSMLEGGMSGPAIVRGDPDASLMIQRIESAACPPRELLLKFFVKRPPKSEVEVLRKWIVEGAATVATSPDVASTDPDPLVSDVERGHWSFQSPKRDPKTRSIDEFVASQLKDKGLAFSPQADRDTLIRRAYIDLIGMPPSLAEWRRWRDHAEPNWFRQMVDHLLESPHYGERWGRYWLDVAGYADSEGGVSSDPVRQVAWKYRDYVIRSFNADKPYDRFLLEQIAGDELIDYERAKVVTPEMVENLVATGFLRMGIDQTGSRTMNFVPERLGVISDVITVIGSGVMGLTLECARCHSHKYDAIPQRDYYRFKSIFQGALDEHDWLTFKNRTLNVDVAERRKRVAEINPPLNSKLKKLTASLKASQTALRLETLKQHYPRQSESDRQDTIKALRIADNNRTLPQRILVEKLQKAEVLPTELQPEAVRRARQNIQDIEYAIDRVRRRMEPSLAIRALWDRGEPSPTYILRRGEHNKPGKLVGPGVPSVLTNGRTPFDVQPPFPNGTSKSGRRLAFARWLTRSDHPLTSRVMVNRIWRHHFGTGLVKSLENFGVKGDPPSHPELLDSLAVQFVESGWSIKAMHRQMMNSRTYQQSSRIDPNRRELDPSNRLLSRMPLRRMDAESLRDSLLFVSGSLDARGGGIPDPVSVDRDGLVTARPFSEGQWRRSVYLQYRRTEIPTLMATFDYPEMGPNCIARSESVVSPQSLMLTNNRRVRDLSSAFARRVDALAHSKEMKQASARKAERKVKLVYQLALSRSPTDQELRIGVETLKQLEVAWREREDAAAAALESYCHTILNSAAFLYVD